MKTLQKGFVALGLSVLCLVFLATEITAAERFCTKDGPITALIVGCPPCLSFDPDLVAQFHQGEQSQQFFDCDTGLPVPGSIIAAEHIIGSCLRGEPGTPPGSVPETCFEPGNDVLPDTILRVAVEVAGVPVLIEAIGTTNVERKGDSPDPGPATIEMDNTTLTGQTDLGQPVTVRIGRSFGLPATLGTVTRVPSPGFPDRVAVAFAINAEITLEDEFPPAGTDTFPTSIVFIDEDENGAPVLLSAQGPTIVERGDPVAARSGQNVIETEILSMELTGQSKLGPVRIRAGQSFGLPPSQGKTVGGSPDRDFPADSFFDVFFDIEVAGFSLCNTQPQRVRATINEIPPLNPLDFSFGSDLLSVPLAPCDNGPESAHPLVANLMAFHCTPQFSGLPPGTDECCVSAVTTYNNGGPFGGPPPAIQLDPDVVCFRCDPDPRTQGYWHRQCLGIPAAEGGIDPGRNGRGPSEPIEPEFQNVLMPAVDLELQNRLFLFGGTCQDGIDADPPSDQCQKAIKQYTALLLNVESGKLQNSCAIDLSAENCASTTVGDLVNELAGLIIGGDCNRAAGCAEAVNEGTALESLTLPDEIASAPDASATIPVAKARSVGTAIGTHQGQSSAAQPVQPSVSTESPLMIWDAGADADADTDAEVEPSAPVDDDPVGAIQRHLAVFGNSAAPERARNASTDALLTALSGGFELEVRLQIVRGLLGKVDVAYESLLAEHLRNIRDEAADFGKEDLAKEAEKLLKRLEPAEQ